MMTRQKIVLLMLKEADRPVQRMELMKWCFLLKQDSISGGGSSFYDFVPYKYGPFSFALYQEIEKLESMNYLVSDPDQAWALNTDQAAAKVEPRIERDVKRIVTEFGRLSVRELLDFVYHRHEWFTANSEIKRLVPRPKAELAVYTGGYEGLSIDSFLNLLVKRGIERLIDVRSNPIARRYGFHKSTLSRLAGHLGIEYHHFGQLGIRPEIRKSFPANSDRRQMFKEYEVNILTRETEAIRAVARLMIEIPSILICMEAKPSCCHRSHLASPISLITGLPIHHLESL